MEVGGGLRVPGGRVVDRAFGRWGAFLKVALGWPIKVIFGSWFTDLPMDMGESPRGAGEGETLSLTALCGGGLAGLGWGDTSGDQPCQVAAGF